MNVFKEKLDKRARSLNHSSAGRYWTDSIFVVPFLSICYVNFRRFRLEKSLRPSSATHLIAPLTLIELWFEQITRHVNLRYLCGDDFKTGSSGLPRGVVYIDGLGDIADLSAPLPKVQAVARGGEISAAEMSTYLIVITSLERCTHEYRRSMVQNGSAVADRCPFLSIRWLRIVVDEGHELSPLNIPPAAKKKKQAIASPATPATPQDPLSQLLSGQTPTHRSNSADAMSIVSMITSGTTSSSSNASAASNASASAANGENENEGGLGFDAFAKDRAFEEQRRLAAIFINSIAAERRWVMSGTPTRGNSSAAALDQVSLIPSLSLRRELFAVNDLCVDSCCDC
jgi:hypothetical protein